jgi:isoquinoline 1-oxidoreductase alpha subunit
MTTLLINGKALNIEAEDSMPLLWAIRDVVGYTGTKFGCGIGLCGACSIHLDGKITRSCVTPEQGLHPVQQAWVEKDVSQCGYCQSGQIMAAAALLQDNPNPSDEEIRAKMTNLCRCGTYLQIFAAVKRAAQIQGEQS